LQTYFPRPCKNSDIISQMNRKVFCVFVMFASMPAYGQTEFDLKKFFEGKKVVLKMDMPATNEGVDAFPERGLALDYDAYGKRIKRFGTAIKSGSEIIITKVHVKEKHIEFQLGGGGYGTAGDDTSNSVPVPYTGKSKREERLEKDIRRETDTKKKREMQDELSDMRSEREREQRMLEMMASEAREQRRQAVEAKRLQGGSRFNLRYDRRLHEGDLEPESVMKALDPYLDFSGLSQGVARIQAVAIPGGAKLSLRKGLLAEEVRALLGKPALTSEHMEGSLNVTGETYLAGGRRIEAEFVEGVLVRYRIGEK
jgi:hypothetical protein